MAAPDLGPLRLRSIGAVSAAWEEAEKLLATYEAEVDAALKRARAANGELATRALALEAQLAAYETPSADYEVTQGHNETLLAALERLEALVPAGAEGFLARVRVTRSSGLNIGSLHHAWWRHGRLELLGDPTTTNAIMGLTINSDAETEWRCELILRDMRIQGDLILHARGGIRLRTVGTTRIFPNPKPQPF